MFGNSRVRITSTAVTAKLIGHLLCQIGRTANIRFLGGRALFLIHSALNIQRTKLMKKAQPRPERPASGENEIAQLKKDVAALRREMNALRRFITVEFDEETDEPTNINIRCCSILFAHPEQRNRMQMIMCAGTNGPAIGMWDSNQRARIHLSVEADTPSVALRNGEHKDCVLIHADAADGRGLVSVLDNGKPRALIKAAPDNSGVLCGVHDDGHSRIFLHSTQGCGTLIAASPDMTTAVKIVSDSPNGGGGTLTIHGSVGQPTVILSNTKLGGAVVVNDRKGKPNASLPRVNFNDLEEDED